MSPNKICGCCHRWACDPCRKIQKYQEAFYPVPAECEINSAIKNNDNQSNSKFLCGECHDKCVMKHYTVVIQASVKTTKELNDKFKELVRKYNPNFPLPPDLVVRYPNFPEGGSVDDKVVKMNEDLRKRMIDWQCQHINELGRDESGNLCKPCETKASVSRTLTLSDCYCCGNATCGSHSEKTKLSVPEHLILLNDEYTEPGYRVCQNCYEKNLVPYWVKYWIF